VTYSIKEKMMVALSETQMKLHIVHYISMSMNVSKSTWPRLSGVGSKLHLLWRIFGWVDTGHIRSMPHLPQVHTEEQLIEDH
jgi:hypothetical protein